jgi:hypothetical protein
VLAAGFTASPKASGELSETEHVAVGVLEPSDACATWRLPNPPFILLRHTVVLEPDAALVQARYSFVYIRDIPTQYSELLRVEILYISHTERGPVRVKH